jgi:voltage-gated potassium channel
MEKMSLRKRLYQILQEPQPGDRLAKAINTFLITLILINVICIILESVPKIDNRYRSLFILIEVVSVALFTVEYLLRIYACKEDSRYVGQGGRFKFSLSGLQLISLSICLYCQIHWRSFASSVSSGFFESSGSSG